MPPVLNPEAAASDYIKEGVFTSPLTDDQLLRSISEGDEQALSILYQRHSRSLYNYAFRLVKERNAAEDVLQEVFVAVWQGAGRFRQHSSVKTWMFKIAHNQSVNWLRRQERFEQRDGIVPQPAGDPEEELVMAWKTEEILAAVDRLSASHRATIELAFVNNLSYAEISEVLDCPVGTVKSRMSHALTQLGRILMGSGIQRD